MASLQERFEAAAKEVKSFTNRPTDVELLEIYGLYKQALEGDNQTSQPGMFDLKGRKKWEFWTNLKGKSKDECKEKYVAKIKELAEKYK